MVNEWGEYGENTKEWNEIQRKLMALKLLALLIM